MTDSLPARRARRGAKPYEGFGQQVLSLLDQAQTADAQPEIAQALDGAAAAALRSSLSISERRSMGAFFTRSELAGQMMNSFSRPLDASSRIADPACGAGDLLLPAVDLILTADPTADLDLCLMGRDTYPAFTSAARLRLILAERTRRAPDQCHKDVSRRFPRLLTGSGLAWKRGLREASHVVMNPPFYAMPTPPGYHWSSGNVSAAAVFVAHCLDLVSDGTQLRAILPDVLRSGSRYKRWRASMESIADVHSMDPLGVFDRFTDVDVFMMSATKGQGTEGSGGYGGQAPTIGDTYSVSVGSVVHYRDKHEGADLPYLVARDLPPAGVTVSTIARRRRFTGRLVQPPFVVVRRTSSPSEAVRARANYIDAPEPVAVDNHLLVLKAINNTQAYDTLIKRLNSANTTRDLNERMRCRHLTVEVIAQLPMEAEPSD